jgi:hypothetical protein
LRLKDHRIKQGTTIAPASKRLIYPHLLDLGYSGPRVSSSDADSPAVVISHYKP